MQFSVSHRHEYSGLSPATISPHTELKDEPKHQITLFHFKMSLFKLREEPFQSSLTVSNRSMMFFNI